MTWYLPDDVLMPLSSREDARSGRMCEAVGHGATMNCTWGSTPCLCPKVRLCVRKRDTLCERRSLPTPLHTLFGLRIQPRRVASTCLVSAIRVINRLTATGDDV